MSKKSKAANALTELSDHLRRGGGLGGMMWTPGKPGSEDEAAGVFVVALSSKKGVRVVAQDATLPGALALALGELGGTR